MADSRTRTTLNLSGLSSRIEELRSDSAWKILPLSKKVMLLLDEYLALIESGQGANGPASDLNNSKSEKSPGVIEYLSSLERRPSTSEVTKVANNLQVDKEELRKICDRLFPESDNNS